MDVHLRLFQGMMKTLLNILVLVMMYTVVEAGNIRALFSFSRFADSGGTPYLETYLNVNGSNLSTIEDVDGSLLGKWR